jgi:hypothetical protein
VSWSNTNPHVHPFSAAHLKPWLSAHATPRLRSFSNRWQFRNLAVVLKRLTRAGSEPLSTTTTRSACREILSICSEISGPGWYVTTTAHVVCELGFAIEFRNPRFLMRKMSSKTHQASRSKLAERLVGHWVVLDLESGFYFSATTTSSSPTLRPIFSNIHSITCIPMPNAPTTLEWAAPN